MNLGGFQMVEEIILSEPGSSIFRTGREFAWICPDVASLEARRVIGIFVGCRFMVEVNCNTRFDEIPVRSVLPLI
jgi:hypothetical protein